jgi:ABC-type branched-subunit amino acid transport system ATPase component
MIRLVSLTKRFSGVLALDNVTQDFPDSGIVSIIGPNGAGKSTLVNVMTGFVKPDNGAWFIDGVDSSYLKPWQIAQSGIARTFQQVRLAEGATVMENLALASRSEDESLWGAIIGTRARPISRFPTDEIFGVLELLKSGRSAREFSYGQKKLLSLECSLVSGARVLMLDEPVAGVHPMYVDKIASALRRFAALGNLVIIVEHDLSFVREVSDEVIVMRSGRIVRHGSVTGVFDYADMLDVFTR